MPTHAAFLRAVNLGSTRKITSAELRAHFEALGFGDVQTFRTSGNVVFSAAREPAARLRARIEKGLTKAAGFEVVVFLRRAAEVREIAEAQPFSPRVVAATAGRLQVVLLERRPSAGLRKKVLALATDDDRLALGKQEVYWLPRGGTQESALDTNMLRELAGPSTVRTKGTIELLASKFF